MKTILYDLKRSMTYLISFAALSFILISFFWQRDTSNYNLGVFSYYFFWMNNLGMLYIISRLYIDDFQTGAIKNLYVAASSIGKILSRRLLSSMAIGFIFFLFSQINVIISYEKLDKAFEITDFLRLSFNMMFIYMLVAIMIGSYAGLISYAVSNHRRAYILAILPPALLHHFLPLILLLTKFSTGAYWRKALEYLPNSLIITWVNTWNVTLTQCIGFLIWVLMFVSSSIIISNHKDLLS